MKFFSNMNYKNINEFGINISNIAIENHLDIISDSIQKRNTIIQQTSVNAYTIVSVQHDLTLREAINKSTLVNIDGMSVVWALKFLGYKHVEKASCPDIFDRLMMLAAEKGYRPFFLGTTPEILDTAIRNLKNEYPTLEMAGSHHGYFNEENAEEIAKLIKESKADMLFLGISSPKKELFSDRYSAYMQVPYIFGVGGVFDILANVTKRAPRWMQNSGLEWLYRFMQEPRRMWRRYLIGNIQFVWIVIKEKLKK